LSSSYNGVDVVVMLSPSMEDLFSTSARGRW